MRMDIRAVVRTYKDNATGEEKKVYGNIGTAWVGEKTNSIKIDMIPLNWDGKAFLNEPYEKDKPMTQGQALNGGKDFAPTDIDQDLSEQLENIPFN